jgi:hypothetical protein
VGERKCGKSSAKKKIKNMKPENDTEGRLARKKKKRRNCVIEGVSE